MQATTKRPSREPYTILPRQIAFVAALLLPTGKFLETPSLLAKYVGGDILLPALLHFLIQTLVLLAIIYAATSSEKTIHERMESALGRGVYVIYAFLALYYLFAAALPLLDLEKFVYAAFFDTAPTAFIFTAFFVIAAFVCTKGLKSIGRNADLCLFLFLIPFFALIAMSFSAADFSHLLPFFASPVDKLTEAFRRSTPHFSDAILLLPLIANCRFKKNDGVKVVCGYGVGAAFSLLFLAVFYAVFSSLAPREHYAFIKIGQYFPALDVIGRVDLLFVYLLSIVLIFYTCLPLQYATGLFARTFGITRKTWISAALNFTLFLLVLFLNKYYDAFYAVISGKLAPVFWLIADLSPLLCLLLPKNKNQKQTPVITKKAKNQTKENANA